MHDHLHPSGIRIHTYGPHYFRTFDKEIWRFVNRFSDFYPYVASVKSLVDGSYESWPVSAHYLRKTVGEYWEPSFRGTPVNLEEACLSVMPEAIYEKFVKGYNIKQWGTDPKALLPSLIRRFGVSKDNDPALKPRHTYQGLPARGYATFMKNMLEGIPVLLNVDYLGHRSSFAPAKLLIYTGPVDQFFGYRLGKLKYRGQAREHTYISDMDFFQPCGQINNPDTDNGHHIRTLEWKHMMPLNEAAKIKGTVITKEVPVTPEKPDDFEYPFPDAHNSKLYRSYKSLADATPNVLFCGRLGEYRYLDMDQAIGRAFVLAKRILTDKCPKQGSRHHEDS